MPGPMEYEPALKIYAKLKIQEREIQEQIKSLNPLIRQEMENRKLDKQPTSIGDFIIVKKKEWKYSDILEETIRRHEEQHEKAKAEEQADGTAIFKEKSELQFRVKKNEPTSA